jgi:hypothetical protein
VYIISNKIDRWLLKPTRLCPILSVDIVAGAEGEKHQLSKYLFPEFPHDDGTASCMSLG